MTCALALLSLACGAPPETPSAASGPSPAAATTAPSAVTSAPPLTSLAPATAASESSAPSTPNYKGIAVSRTADGFFVLGSPDAPVTLTDYSDFL